MEVYLEEFIQWIFTLSQLSILSIFFLIAYLENVLPPIPGDILIVFGGYMAAENVVGFTPLLAVTVVASVLGFMSMYAIGSYWGYRIDQQKEQFWLVRIIDRKYFDRGKRWMYNWGQGVILANRFLTGTRSVIALTAGIYRTKVNYTVLNSAISSLLWNSLLLGCGWVVYENWEVIGSYLNIYGWVIMSILLLIVLARIIYVRRFRAGRLSAKKELDE